MPGAAGQQVINEEVTDRDRYLIVSSDSHAGPSLERELRPYCPKKYLTAFDEYATAYREALATMPDQMIQDASAPAPEEYPAHRGLAFRDFGPFA